MWAAVLAEAAAAADGGTPLALPAAVAVAAAADEEEGLAERLAEATASVSRGGDITWGEKMRKAKKDEPPAANRAMTSPIPTSTPSRSPRPSCSRVWRDAI